MPQTAKVFDPKRNEERIFQIVPPEPTWEPACSDELHQGWLSATICVCRRFVFNVQGPPRGLFFP